MAANYIVKCSVIDISNDIPDSNDVFLVDSNVWYWQTYNRASQGGSPPLHYQLTAYPTYLKAAIEFGSQLHWCALSLAELANLVERTEREIFAKLGQEFEVKEFRHNFPNVRGQVVSEIQNAWRQVGMFATNIEAFADQEAAESLLKRLGIHALDGTDYFLLDAMADRSVTNILTDDGDFCTVEGICVFTANRGVVQAAQNQGKLVHRPARRS